MLRNLRHMKTINILQRVLDSKFHVWTGVAVQQDGRTRGQAGAPSSYLRSFQGSVQYWRFTARDTKELNDITRHILKYSAPGTLEFTSAAVPAGSEALVVLHSSWFVVGASRDQPLMAAFTTSAGDGFHLNNCVFCTVTSNSNPPPHYK
jgi:hypothetical protein